MIGSISGSQAYYGVYNPYTVQRGAVQGAQQSTGVWAARKAASPETPVEPVRPVRAVDGQEQQPVRLGPVLREGADPAEMAVRMRIKPYEEPAPRNSQAPVKEQEGSGKEQKVGAEGAQAAMEEGKCQTCEKRKYQDESDDMGVSFQSPTNIAPEQVASAVRGHENEHVVRERAKAQQEDRRVVSQSVTLHTDICPECGKVYISGGTTRTVTAANPEQQAQQETRQEQEREGLDVYV